MGKQISLDLEEINLFLTKKIMKVQCCFSFLILLIKEKYWCVRNMYIIYGETDHQPRLDAWDKCSGLVHWEDPEELGREGGGRGDWDGEYM